MNEPPLCQTCIRNALKKGKTETEALLEGMSMDEMESYYDPQLQAKVWKYRCGVCKYEVILYGKA